MTNTVNQMEFYYENEAEQFLFYRVPKMLFKDKRFSKISSDAKLLYALFLDRMALSRMNGWVDEENRVYIYFPIQDIMNEFAVATEKCTRIMAELDDVKGCGLIHKKKQGQGKPTKIYVMKYTLVNAKDSVNTKEIQQSEDFDNSIENKETNGNSHEDSSKQTTYEPEKIEIQNLKNSKNKTFENRNSELLENEIQDFRNLEDKYNTESNNIDLSNLYPDLYEQNIRIQTSSTIKQRKQYKEMVKSNIAYDILVRDNPNVDIDGIVEIMLDAILNRREYLNINGDKVSQELVRAKMLHLTPKHIRYVIDFLRKNTEKKDDIKSYVLAVLYDSYAELKYCTELV